MPIDRLILSENEPRPVRITLTARQSVVDSPFGYEPGGEGPSLFRVPGMRNSYAAYRYVENRSDPDPESPGGGPAGGPEVTPERFPEALDYAIDDMIDRDTDGYGFPPEDEEEDEEEDLAIDALLTRLGEIFREEGAFGDDDLITRLMGTMERKTLPDGSLELTIAYEEAMPLEGTRTAITLNSRRPDVVTIARFGPISSMIVCEVGVRHTTAYRTPFAALELAVVGRRCDARVSYARGGVIELDYLVEIRGTDLQYTRMKIEIETVEER